MAVSVTPWHLLQFGLLAVLTLRKHKNRGRHPVSIPGFTNGHSFQLRSGSLPEPFFGLGSTLPLIPVGFRRSLAQGSCAFSVTVPSIGDIPLGH